MSTNPAFIVALVIGVTMLGAVCFVYVKHQTFGLGGTCLSGFGVILIGMSVWKTVDVSFDEKGIKAKLEQVESTAARAESSASKAQMEARQTSRTVAGLQSTVDVTLAQQKLKAEGLYQFSADGYLGPATQAALQTYQRSKGLAITGELDEATKQSLQIGTPPRLITE